jgi:hypothetical protein
VTTTALERRLPAGQGAAEEVEGPRVVQEAPEVVPLHGYESFTVRRTLRPSTSM